MEQVMPDWASMMDREALEYCANRKIGTTASGANPNNRHRHRQAGGEGADDRQCECSKQICLRAQLVYRHVACSTTRISRKAATETNAMTAPTRARVSRR